jgi:hypothetical protein
MLLDGTYTDWQNDSWICMADGARASKPLSHCRIMCPNCLPTSYDIVFCYLASCVEGCLDSSISGLFFERELLQLDYADSRVASLVGYLE